MGSEKPSFEVFSNTIDGKSHNSGKTSHAIDPSTGKSLWEVPCALPQDLDDAVAAAQNSFETWSTTPWKQRQGLLTEVRQALEKVAEEMVTLIMREGGKPVCTPCFNKSIGLTNTSNSIETSRFYRG
jgi:acyl-CoA reductase-like NAD-dependent aldehyde dehydrogenase